MARKKPAARADQPRPSKAVRALRDALGLDEEDWQAYLRHALHGFAEYEAGHVDGPRHPASAPQCSRRVV